MEAIKTVGLSKYYGKSRGIESLDLVVEKGDFFGFIGPNGAGKSTTIRTLLGLILATSGNAWVLGMDIKEKEAILKRVGYLPSEAIFYNKMRVKDVLKFASELRKQNCDAEAIQLCERLQLDMNKKVEELSLGNRKKVGIVCALQHNPELLILDEPTSGLDPLIQQEFFKILQERNQQGVTIFLSSHILSEIQKNCNKAAIIKEGRIIACNSVEELSKTNAKRIMVRSNMNVDDIKDFHDVQKHDDQISFLYNGNMNDLIHLLSKYDISDLSINEPDLEEIFMHYYSEE
ncbi:MAG: ABC transporter ATP-binding protein [Traorella sp.]